MLILASTLFGCATSIETERSTLYYRELGDQLYSEGEYGDASEAYEEALLRAETPEDAAEIQLALANSYYFDEKYKEAIPVYEVYLDIYSETRNAAQAYLNAGLSYYELKPSIKKDSSFLVNTQKYLNNAIVRDPNLLTPEVSKILAEINEALAEKELIIAKYYDRIWQPGPYVERLKYIVNNYENTKVYPEALARLAIQLAEENDIEGAQKYYDQLFIIAPSDRITRNALDAINEAKNK